MLDPVPLMKKLQAIAEKHTKDFQDEATQTCKRTKRASHIQLPDPAPQITFTARDFNNLHFTVRAYMPTRETALLTSQITQDFMTEVAKLKLKQKKEEEQWRHQA